MPYFNIVAQTSENTVVIEYVPIRYNKFRKLWTAGSKKREDKAAAVW